MEWDLVPGILPGLSLAVLRDVTERREVQARLALADRLISVGTLAAGMAHELNTPLAYVAANLEYLLRAVPPAAPDGARAEIVEALRETAEGVERLRVIIEDLRTFVRTTGDDRGPAEFEVKSELSLWLPAAKSFSAQYFDGTGALISEAKANLPFRW